MLLSKDEKLVVYIDQSVNRILSNNKNPIEILIVLGPVMEDIKKLLDSVSRKDLDEYCEKYDGFCIFLIFMEDLVDEVSNGNIPFPNYH